MGDRILDMLTLKAPLDHGQHAEVISGGTAPSSRERIEVALAVIVCLGPLRLSCTAAQAIELGDALIRAAHHFRAQAHAYYDRAEAVEA